MYTRKNFKTKKSLREAVAAGEKVGIYQPGLGGPAPTDGTVFLEGPHYPAPHTWYAEAEVRGGVIVKVK